MAQLINGKEIAAGMKKERLAVGVNEICYLPVLRNDILADIGF